MGYKQTMPLEKYVEKRNFDATPEPGPEVKESEGLPRFVVQLHRATRLHYDFRLEVDGVLKSWPVPKGPSMNPADKRMAIMVEDHPMDYRLFEGIIPKGNYGAGTVMVWDEGTYTVPDATDRESIEKAMEAGLQKGHLAFVLRGHKLRGLFDLIKMHGREENAWLLVKRKDEFATTEDVLQQNTSVLTGRTLEEIKEQASSAGQVWFSDRDPVKIDLHGAPEGPMLHDVKPMLAQEKDKPFDREGWLFEVKWDGYRAIAEVEAAGDVRLYSRNQLSFNERYPGIVASLKTLGHAAVFDGEVVVVDEKGCSIFQWLQDWQRNPRGTLLYYVFDILYLDGHDLQSLPLTFRKEILSQVVSGEGRVRFSGHVETSGASFYEAVKAQGLEGIVAKKEDSRYIQGKRTADWLKIKALNRQLAVVGGFTQPRNSRKHFGALVLGVYEGDDLVYVGHAGGGFDDATLEGLKNSLEPLVTDQCPFVDPPTTNTPVTWVRPELVCEVIFRGWTESGVMRQPVFNGVRPGVDPRSVHRTDSYAEEPLPEPDALQEQPGPRESSTTDEAVAPVEEPRRFAQKSKDARVTIDGQELKLTNLDKVYWPDEGYTKGDLIQYYREVSGFILPYLQNRPESMRRNPNGITGQSFFQKDAPKETPSWIETVEIHSDSGDKNIRYIVCQNEAALVYLANLGCIELNPWHSRLPSLHKPDYVVIDLDPLDVTFDKVVETALMVRRILEDINVPSYPKTSGSKGIHIYIPTGAKYDYDQGRQFAELIARLVHGELPAVTSVERSPSKRPGKVYVDFLQNREAQTLAAAYSVRPKPGATVSTPLVWEEVNAKLHPSAFTIRTMCDRLQRVGDLFKPILGEGIDMMAALEAISRSGYAANLA